MASEALTNLSKSLAQPPQKERRFKYNDGRIVNRQNQVVGTNSYNSKTNDVRTNILPTATLPTNTSRDNAGIVSTPFGARTTPLSINIPNQIPSTALSSDTSRNDVLRYRDELQGKADVFGNANSTLDGIEQAHQSPFSFNTLSNPDSILLEVLKTPAPTQAEQKQTGLLQGIADTTRDYYSNRGADRNDVYKEYGVNDLKKAAEQTAVQLAEREKKLREDLRAFDGSGTGAARVFRDDTRQRIVADATAEMADLAIIQNAQNGNLDRALSLANNIVDQQFQDFQGQIEAQKADLAALEPTLNAEQKQRALQLQVMLDERSRLLQQQAQNQKDIRSIMAEAAANGADTQTLNAIRAAQSPEQAYVLGGQWIGRLDRLKTNADIANTYSQISSRQTQDLLDLAEKGDPDAISKLGFDPRSTTGNFEAESALRKEFNALKPVAAAQEVQQSYSQITSAYQQALQAGQDGTSKSAADQALIISFNKMLDPNSVVREGEFARSTQGQALISKWRARMEQLAQGGAGLSDAERGAIVSVTQQLYAGYVQSYNDRAFQYRQDAIRQGGDPDYVAGYMDTIGLSAANAEEGDIIIINGIPYQRQGDQMVMLEI